MAENRQTRKLKRIIFDKSLLNTWWAKYLTNIRLVILFIMTIVTVGVTSFVILPRRLNPEIKLTIVTVSTVLPGAGPADVESLVTVPIEDKLLGVKGLDTITSSSMDNVSVVVMQFLSSVDKDTARNDVQTAVNEVSGLPGDAMDPRVAALDFEDSPIWTFGLHSTTDTPSLMAYADQLQKEIERVSGVDRVTLNGYDEQQIQVVMDQNKIRALGINPLVLSGAVKTATQAFPAGLVESDRFSFSLAIDAAATTIDDIRNIHVTVSGKTVKLGDVASVMERSKPNQTKSYVATADMEPNQIVTFAVYKTSAADITKTVKAVEKLVDEQVGKNEGRFDLVTISNSGEDIGKEFTDLVGEFRSTIILVFLNLLLFLGARQALIACMTIPLTFLMSFLWMSVFGQTINFISLFALLLAFGTSIDDTIVTVSAMTAYHKRKFTPHQAAVMVWRDLVVPIWTTTVTTVWAFFPLILTGGIIGEFIKPIPLVVATTMYSSTFVAWFITLPMMMVMLKPNLPRRVKVLGGILGLLISMGILGLVLPKNGLLTLIMLVYLLLLGLVYKLRKQLGKIIGRWYRRNKWARKTVKLTKRIVTRGVIDTEVLSEKYEALITKILGSKRWRRITLVSLVAFALSSYLLLPLGLVKNEFFPKTNQDLFYVSLEMPPGTNNLVVDDEAQKVLETLRNTPEARAVVADAGKTTGNMGGTSNSGSSVLFSVILTPKEERKVTSSEIAQGVRDKLADYTDGKITVAEESSGPPAGADVAIKLSGESLENLDEYADKVKVYLAGQPGVINVDKSVKSGTSKIVFVPDKSKLSAAGLGADAVGLYLRIAASGLTLDTVKFNDRDEDVVFYNSTDNLTAEDLGKINIPTTTGGYVPLVSLGEVRLENNPTVITREEGKRTVSVSAGVLPGYSISGINKQLESYANGELALADGYEWKTGGVNEENQKSVNSLLQAMGLSFVLIMATMVVEFGSYRQAAIILSLIPFAVAGVFWVFGLTGTPLSFPALIGVMAMFGVVVTNAMFIVEKINQNRKAGMELVRAIADAGRSRLEPIMLTAITGILGLVPITLANALWRGLGGAIIAGLMFSGVIMLLFVPLTYYSWFGGEGKRE